MDLIIGLIVVFIVIAILKSLFKLAILGGVIVLLYYFLTTMM